MLQTGVSLAAAAAPKAEMKCVPRPPERFFVTPGRCTTVVGEMR